MQLAMLGLNYKTAPVAVRERYCFPEQTLATAISVLYGNREVQECVLLSTCNRSELYVVLQDGSVPYEIVLELFGLVAREKIVDRSYFFFLEGQAAIRHLFMVSCSLDSLVIGEGQILSQVKQAYLTAHKNGVTGPILNLLFHRAITVGKQVRTVTDIGNSPVSISYAAVELAHKALNDLQQSDVLILGAGTMGELTARYLVSCGVRSIFVSNRSFDRAQRLAEQFNGQAIPFHEFLSCAVMADIVITSTGAPHYIITVAHARELMKNRGGRPIIFLDIAVPRDVDPEVTEIPGITLYNIDKLEAVVAENRQKRTAEGEKAIPFIEAAVEEVVHKLNYLPMRPAMVLIQEKAERIRRREVRRALTKIDKTDYEARQIIDKMSHMLVRKLLRDPMIRFSKVAGTDEEEKYQKMLRDMFQLEE